MQIDETFTQTNLYRRHNTDTCKNPSRCDCPFWLYGYVRGQRIRESLKTRRTDVALDRQKRREGLLPMADAAPTAEPRANNSLKERIEIYLQWSKIHAGIAEKTETSYRYALQSMLEFLERREIRNLENLTKEAIADYLTLGLVHLAPGTRLLYRRILKAFFNYCIDIDLLTKAPMPRRAPKTVVSDAHRPLNTDEQQRLFLACYHEDRNRTAQCRAVLWTFLSTGLRISDVTRLTMSNIDFNARVLRITPKKTASRSAKEVIVPNLPAAMLDAIRALPRRVDGFVFSPHLDTMKSLMRSMFKRAKVDGSAHDLRSTFAVERLKEGASIWDVSKLLGHASVTLTEKYYAKWVPDLHKRLEVVMSKADFSHLRAA